MKGIIIAIIVLFSLNSYAQVLGVSNSKLASTNALTATHKQVEFEPGFGYYWANKNYDDTGKLNPLSENNDSVNIYQAMVFRFTYGITKRLEAGMLIAADMSSLSLGAKYTMFTANTFSGAVFAGGTLANESDIVAVNSGIFGKTYSIALGLAFTNQFSQKLSLDIDGQYQWIRDNKTSYSNDIFANAELGYVFSNQNQIVGGFSYAHNSHTYEYDGQKAYLLSLNMGALITSGKMYQFSFLFPIVLMGKNYDRLNGFNFALTIFLN